MTVSPCTSVGGCSTDGTSSIFYARGCSIGTRPGILPLYLARMENSKPWSAYSQFQMQIPPPFLQVPARSGTPLRHLRRIVHQMVQLQPQAAGRVISSSSSSSSRSSFTMSKGWRRSKGYRARSGALSKTIYKRRNKELDEISNKRYSTQPNKIVTYLENLGHRHGRRQEFFFLGSASEALTSFLFFGLVKRVSGYLPLGSTTAKGETESADFERSRLAPSWDDGSS